MIIKTENLRVRLSYKDLEYILYVFSQECKKMEINKEYNHRVTELKYLFEYIKADEAPLDVYF